ncbi:hypothetical protein LDDCCGHA_1696 [Methylobacterium oxalidis]|nr:hypothetical protein LDDCCGHA_1696 [Methylobacterium oxalidis]
MAANLFIGTLFRAAAICDGVVDAAITSVLSANRDEAFVFEKT